MEIENALCFQQLIMSLVLGSNLEMMSSKTLLGFWVGVASIVWYARKAASKKRARRAELEQLLDEEQSNTTRPRLCRIDSSQAFRAMQNDFQDEEVTFDEAVGVKRMTEENDGTPMPRMIILLRHGESLGNVKEHVYQVIPDWCIPLTENGREQARKAGLEILDEIGERKVAVFYSPYSRTVETLESLLEVVPPNRLVLVQEEPRIREQDFGNFQTSEMKEMKQERKRFGRFFYRFPNGESGADVYDRISSFFETLFRQFKRAPLCKLKANDEFALIIISHGLTIRLFLMRWFHWTVRFFEKLYNPSNCKPIVLRRNQDSYLYRLDEESWRTLGMESAFNEEQDSTCQFHRSDLGASKSTLSSAGMQLPRHS